MIIVKTPQCTTCKYSHICKYRDTIKETFSKLYEKHGKDPLDFITVCCQNDKKILKKTCADCVTCAHFYICKYQEKVNDICSEVYYETRQTSVTVGCKYYRKEKLIRL